MASGNLSEQEIIRRQKLLELKQLGIESYPAELFPVTHYSTDIKSHFSEEVKDQFTNVSLAGRIMSINDKGKVCFLKIQDAKGILQLYIRRDDVCPGDDKTLFDKVVKHLLDLGDIIGVSGYVFITKTGETSLHVTHLKLLAKALKPLPVVKRDDEGRIYDAVTDPEFKYRQRYADLIVNPEVRDVFVKRSRMINTMRDFLNERGAIEVDTPVLQAIPGGAAARPFITHHNALDVPFYLRVANELYLKRLIVGGFDWVYEFSRDFRNEGMDRTHNPEFTILEWYTAYKDYFWMMEITEQMMEKIAVSLHGVTLVRVSDTGIDFKAPYPRVTIFEAIKQHTGVDVSDMDEQQLRDVCKQFHLHTEASMGKGKLIDELFGELCEQHYINPTFIIDYPVEMSPLTKKHRSKPGLVERFELIINGKEIANAYSELNDPLDQRERFEEQVQLMQRGDDEAMFIDYDFLRALEYGMPPTSGIGIGIDRLTMLMTNQPSIQDVLLFPQMRPEAWNREEKKDESDLGTG